MHIFLIIGTAAEMKNWNAAKVFSYKEIKAATNNFKEVIGRGSFGSVYLGKLPDGKQVAVEVRFDKTQLGADSFINEVRHYTHASSVPVYKEKRDLRALFVICRYPFYHKSVIQVLFR